MIFRIYIEYHVVQQVIQWSKGSKGWQFEFQLQVFKWEESLGKKVGPQ